MGGLLGLKPKMIHGEYKLSDYPVDILSFHKPFLECDLSQGMTFRGKRSGLTHIFTMDVDPGFKYIGKFRRDISCFMVNSSDFVSNTIFETKDQKN